MYPRSSPFGDPSFHTENTESEQDMIGPLAQLARDTHLTMMSKGFDEQQAFHLTSLVIQAGMLRKD